MNSDFHDAHLRHWEDAEYLYLATRMANADHLYGLSAECGLKRLMLAFGMPVDSQRGDPRLSVDKKHADRLWDRYESYRSGYHSGSRYLLSGTNPFSNWNISHRYAARNHFPNIHVDAHRSGAKHVMSVVSTAVLDGLL